MTLISQAKDISLDELHSEFNLQPVPSQGFFDEWRQDLPVLSEFERSQLARLQQNYANLSGRNFSEEAVKMVVLSPLLDLAELYRAPFRLYTEESVEITSEDEGRILKGKIDVLVIRQQLWVLTIESKSTRFDVLTALPQALTYMLSAPDRDKPAYGLLVNGREFVFVKLVHEPTPTYARSFALSIERDNDLEQVLSILKTIRDNTLLADSTRI